MPTNDIVLGHTPDPAPRKRPSTAAKLVQAAALAAVLVPLGSVAMEADTITCGFSGYASDGNNGGEGCTNSFGNNNRYEFGDYYFELTFNGLDPNANFDVAVSNNEMTAGDFAERAGSFEGYDCIPLTEGGPCVDFVVDFPDGYPDPPSTRPWIWYDLTIHWTWDSNSQYPAGDGPIPNVRVLHDIGGTADDSYDEDMCLVYNNCVYDSDPGIRSGDTDFRSFTAAHVAVPEPSSLIPLTAGIGGVLANRRRRRPRA